MPGVLGLAGGNPPGIRTPGFGPNGPGPIDARRPVTHVGECSTVPYGPTLGYANPNGVTGFIGPAAGSLQQPSTWYVRAGGSNTNGGTSSNLSPDRSGSDGVTNGTTTFTSASANFTPADVGQGIFITLVTANFRIVSVVNSTTVVLSDPVSPGGSGRSWNLGGATADLSHTIGSNGATNPNKLRANDVVYVGAGIHRSTTQIGQTIPFNGVVNVVADVTGQYTGDAGMVQLTAYTTNDKTAPSATTLLNLNGKSNLAFSNFVLVGGSANAVVTATTATSQNITFTDCSFESVLLTNAQLGIRATNAAGVPFNWLIDRCYFLTSGGIVPTLVTSNGGDYDANFTIRNSFYQGTGAFCAATNSGTLAGSGGGIRIRNCTILAGGNVLSTVASRFSLIFPCTVNDSLLITIAAVALNAGTSGQITESNNLIYAGTPRTNVTAGTGSISDGSYAPLFHFGQERIWGALLRQFGEPMSASPLLSFGNDGAQTLYDLANRPRPAGGGSGLPYPAVGALERSNTSVQGSSPVPPSGTYTWQGTGPWYQEFLLPLSNTATTVSVSVQRDAAYAPPPGLGLPQMLILPNGTIGVAAQTITDTGGSGSWNTLTSAQFTPSGTGWVTVRIASYDGSGTSVVSFADFTIA